METTTSNNYTPLMLSIIHKKNDIFDYLINIYKENHVDYELTKDAFGNTMLHLCVLHMNYHATQVLSIHAYENNFRMTAYDYSKNMMRSHFYHAHIFEQFKNTLGIMDQVYFQIQLIQFLQTYISIYLNPNPLISDYIV
jgi:ankyrin repeat protein